MAMEWNLYNIKKYDAIERERETKKDKWNDRKVKSEWNYRGGERERWADKWFTLIIAKKTKRKYKLKNLV